MSAYKITTLSFLVKKSTMKLSGVYYIFTAPVLPSSTFIVDQVFSLSAASHILRNIYTQKNCESNLILTVILILESKGLYYNIVWHNDQGLQISLMSGVSLTYASQILESFWNIWSQVSDFPARGPGMYTLLWGIHEVAVPSADLENSNPWWRSSSKLWS